MGDAALAFDPWPCGEVPFGVLTMLTSIYAMILLASCIYAGTTIHGGAQLSGGHGVAPGGHSREVSFL